MKQTGATKERCLLLVGMGMIGGSVLHAAMEARSANKIIGFDADLSAMREAFSLGLTENNSGTLEELAPQASLIVLAAPPLAMASVFEALGALDLADDVVISDVASVKGPVLEACKAHAPKYLNRFLPAHPIAGSEKSGLAASRLGLFKAKKLILTPHAGVEESASQRVTEFWQGLECQLASLECELHDELLAATSHLPHVLAYVLVDSLLRHPQTDRLFEFAAGGFQDISRTASSDPTMWHDIFMSNKSAVLDALTQFESRLSVFRRLVENGDSQELHKMLQGAKDGRDDYLAKYRS